MHGLNALLDDSILQDVLVLQVFLPDRLINFLHVLNQSRCVEKREFFRMLAELLSPAIQSGAIMGQCNSRFFVAFPVGEYATVQTGGVKQTGTDA